MRFSPYILSKVKNEVVNVWIMKFNAVCSYLPTEIANMKLDMKIPRNTDLKVPVRYLFDDAKCTSE